MTSDRDALKLCEELLSELELCESDHTVTPSKSQIREWRAALAALAQRREERCVRCGDPRGYFQHDLSDDLFDHRFVEPQGTTMGVSGYVVVDKTQPTPPPSDAAVPFEKWLQTWWREIDMPFEAWCALSSIFAAARVQREEGPR